MDEVSSSKFVSLLERSPGAWVHLACRHWVACCPSLDWEQRLHSEKKPTQQNKVSTSTFKGATYSYRVERCGGGKHRIN